jgi:hypothetical protein
MIQTINEEILMEIAKDILDSSQLDTFTDEEKIHILTLVDGAIRKYIAKDNNVTLKEMDYYWADKKKLSDL